MKTSLFFNPVKRIFFLLFSVSSATISFMADNAGGTDSLAIMTSRSLSRCKWPNVGSRKRGEIQLDRQTLAVLL